MDFKLYITGNSARAKMVIEQVKSTLQSMGAEYQDLEVIDVLQNPDLADRDYILATPTLMACEQGASKRMVGDFSNPQKVMACLNPFLHDPGKSVE